MTVDQLIAETIQAIESAVDTLKFYRQRGAWTYLDEKSYQQLRAELNKLRAAMPSPADKQAMRKTR